MSCSRKLNFRNMRIGFITGIFSILCSSSICASYSPADCSTPCFDVELAYLYFKPYIDNNFIASPNLNAQNPFTLQPGGPGKRNKFDYASGLRAGVSYYNSNPCGLIQNGCICFTYLPAQHDRKISLASFLSSSSDSEEAQIAPPGSLASSHHIHYYAVDALVTFPVLNISGLSCSVQPGLHYADVNYESRGHFSSADLNADLKEHSQSWGLGPQLGFNINYQCVDQISINVSLKGGLLFSRAQAHFQTGIKNGGSNFILSTPTPKTRSKVFPFWETSVGIAGSFLAYDHECYVEVGYEYITYSNFIDRVQYPGSASLNKADNVFSDFDLQGPFASVRIDF